MSMEKNNSFADMPISPDKNKEMAALYWDPRNYPGDTPCVPTWAVSVKSNIFVIIREIARLIVNGTESNKKARIVLEYDPQSEKMFIQSFMTRDEAVPPTDRESFAD